MATRRSQLRHLSCNVETKTAALVRPALVRQLHPVLSQPSRKRNLLVNIEVLALEILEHLPSPRYQFYVFPFRGEVLAMLVVDVAMQRINANREGRDCGGHGMQGVTACTETGKGQDTTT